MIYRQLDENWDYVFGKGVHAYLSGVEAVAQAIRSRLLLFYGEWWEALKDGLPLWERILGTSGHPDNLAAVDYLFKERISGTEGVISIIAYESSYENRFYKFRAAVETRFGTLIITNAAEGTGS